MLWHNGKNLIFITLHTKYATTKSWLPCIELLSYEVYDYIWVSDHLANWFYVSKLKGLEQNSSKTLYMYIHLKQNLYVMKHLLVLINVHMYKNCLTIENNFDGYTIFQMNHTETTITNYE